MFSTLRSKARLLGACAGIGLLAALAACGDSTPTAAPIATPAGIAVSGTAAVGAPLKNATVSLLCGKGGAASNATTGSDGSYGMTLDAGCTAPYFLKVVGLDTSVTPNATVTLYAFADAAGNINITPLTHIAASVATGGDPEKEYQAVLKQSKTVDKSWNDTTKADAKAKLVDKLKDLGLDEAAGKISDILQGKFKADGVDPLDKLLDDLKKKRGGVPLDSLVEQIVKTGGASDGAPWKMLFPAGSNTVQVVGTKCDINTDLTVTLTKNDNTLTISANPGTNSFAFTPIVIGNSTTSTFEISLRGQSPTVEHLAVGVTRNGGFTFDGFTFNSSAGQSSTSFTDGKFLIRCSSVTKPLVRSALSFDLPTRLASMLAGTTTTVLASKDGVPFSDNDSCNTYTPSTDYTSYTYAISKAGNLSIDAVSITSDYLNAPNTFYNESISTGQTGIGGQYSITVTTDTNINKYAQLRAVPGGNVPVRASCYNYYTD